MQSFEELFRKSNGQPVIYNGTTVQLFDRLIVPEGQKLKVVFESVNSNWRQGLLLKTDGMFEVNNHTAEKSVILWSDTAPHEVVLKISTKNGECTVKNVWDTGNGLMQSSHNGAAMIVEQISSGRRYKCNDGQPDDDFDDIIFRIELIK